jgi:hypothetical protein
VSNTKRAGRRARLLARKRPTVDYQLAVVDELDAVAELAAAREAFEVAQLRVDDGAETAVVEAEKRVEQARKAVEACYEPVTFTALPPVEFEALVAAHPSREGKEEQWNGDTFPPACFLACVDTAELSADEWAEFVQASVSQAERVALFAAAIGINARWPNGSIPND